MATDDAALAGKVDRVMKIIALCMLALMIFGIIWFMLWLSESNSQTGGSSSSSSYAYRTIPMNLLTGADFLTMSFTERQTFVAAERKGTHCPTGVNDNDLAIGVTQAANTAGGASQNATQLLAVLLTLDGCVTG